MMVFVMGGSGSGKSAYAEQTVLSLSAQDNRDGRLYYLATMQVCDAESRIKAARHRSLRSGKGFVTIEQPVTIDQALVRMEPGERTSLLECISNLTANEMFSGKRRDPEIQTAEQVAERIIKGITQLQENMIHLVVVSNNVFEDGIAYDEATMEYIRAMGRIHQGLAAMADRIVEVVAGIPIIIKT